jgi:hypothetical protein
VCLFKEHLLERIFARLSFVPAYRVHLTVKLFNYQTYQATTQGFKVATKKTAELPTAEGSVLGGIQSCLCSGEVVLDEPRKAFLGFFEFGGVSESKGARTKDQVLKRHWPCSSMLVQLAAVSPVLFPPGWWFEPATIEVGFPAALRA